MLHVENPRVTTEARTLSSNMAVWLPIRVEVRCNAADFQEKIGARDAISMPSRGIGWAS